MGLLTMNEALAIGAVVAIGLLIAVAVEAYRRRGKDRDGNGT